LEAALKAYLVGGPNDFTITDVRDAISTVSFAHSKLVPYTPELEDKPIEYTQHVYRKVYENRSAGRAFAIFIHEGSLFGGRL
jgi:hypothetical protein